MQVALNLANYAFINIFDTCSNFEVWYKRIWIFIKITYHEVNLECNRKMLQLGRK